MNIGASIAGSFMEKDRDKSKDYKVTMTVKCN
jgi:hypothetical protein